MQQVSGRFKNTSGDREHSTAVKSLRILNTEDNERCYFEVNCPFFVFCFFLIYSRHTSLPTTTLVPNEALPARRPGTRARTRLRPR